MGKTWPNMSDIASNGTIDKVKIKTKTNDRSFMQDRFIRINLRNEYIGIFILLYHHSLKKTR